MTDAIRGSHDNPPITSEDLVKLGVEPELIPFVVSTTQQAEQSPNGSPPLSPVEAENLVEILDKVVSSNTVTPSLKNRCFRVLRKVSPSHGILPKSYFPEGVTLSDTIPYASGGFADIWKGRRDGSQVCVKAFRTQTTGNLEKIKRRFYREVIGWKYITHPNVLPFSGVSETLFSFCIISPWLSNGNITEYTRKNQGANRLLLLAQAACGLEYLHSLSIVHSDINPGNILIADDGTARLGDFGITAVITDPTVVEPGSTTTSKPGIVRYMAPELLNPSQYSLPNSNPSKESDVYSLAMTAYETLTEILPYGNARDGIIIFHVVTGDRPQRPPNARWLKDHIWNMIITCWSDKRDQRWDIRTVYNQLSVSSIQEVAETGQDDQTTARELSIVTDTLPKPLPAVPQNVRIQEEERTLPELPNPSVPQAAKLKTKLKRKLRSQTAPVLGAAEREPPKRRLSWPILSTLQQTEGENDGQRQGLRDQFKRFRRNAMSQPLRGWRKLRGVLKAILKLRRLARNRRNQSGGLPPS